MTAEDLLHRLEAVRQQARGWTARCPAHSPDRNPSLSVYEGERGILLKCWAGCTLQDITAALDLRPSDLFYDSGLAQEHRRAIPPKPRPFDWRKYASELEDEALTLWVRGEAVLKAARGLDTREWDDADREEAMEAVTCAHVDLARSECFENLAFSVRSWGLKKEREHGATL